MTEGIIDRVFTKRIQLHDCMCPDRETNVREAHFRMELIDMKQELKAEIEKMDVYFGCAVMLDQLLGNGEKK